MTNTERNRMALLRAIRDGRRFSKASDPLAALSRADLVSLDRDPLTNRVQSARLTPAGEVYLARLEPAALNFPRPMGATPYLKLEP